MLKVVRDAEASDENTTGAAGGSLLDEVVRDGARQMLAAALQAEVTAYVEQFIGEVGEQGHRLVVRNGYHAEREVTTAARRHLDELLAFYDYPAEHWIPMRTTNPVESAFATVRLRQRVTKGPGSRAAGVAMAFKLIESAQAGWRTVNAPHLVALVRAGAKFERGQLVERPVGSGGDQQVA
jgi:hypothetical protein